MSQLIFRCNNAGGNSCNPHDLTSCDHAPKPICAQGSKPAVCCDWNLHRRKHWSAPTSSLKWASGDQSIPSINVVGNATVVCRNGTNHSDFFGMRPSAPILSRDQPRFVSIAVAPADASITIGTKQQFTAAGTPTDGSAEGLTASVAVELSQREHRHDRPLPGPGDQPGRPLNHSQRCVRLHHRLAGVDGNVRCTRFPWL